MLTQKLLAVATGGSDWILYLLIILSVCSVAIIIERFFALRGILNTSQKVGERAKEGLKANDLSVLDDLSRNHDALEGRLLAHAIRHISKGGKSPAEIMNGFILMEKRGLEKNLG